MIFYLTLVYKQGAAAAGLGAALLLKIDCLG